MESNYRKAMVLYLIDMNISAVSKDEDGISGIFPFQGSGIEILMLGSYEPEEILIKEQNEKIDIKMKFMQKDMTYFEYEFSYYGKYFIIWDNR